MPEDVSAEEVSPSVTPDFDAIDAAFERAYPDTPSQTAEEILVGPEAAATTAETTQETQTEQDPTPENEGEAAAQQAAPAVTQSDESPQIDPSLIALAVQEGADETALNELITEDPEQAQVLLSELAENVNAQTLRTLQGQPNPTGQADQSVQPATSDDTKVSALEELLTNEDALAAAKDEHGEAYVEKYLLPLAEQAKSYREDRAFITQTRQEMEVQKNQALVVQINSSFDSFGVGYKDFYGTDPVKATEQQQANRESVTVIADKLRVSDLMSGKEEKAVRHYLTQAHTVVSVEEQRAATRRELLSKITTRSKTTTAKPNRSKTLGSGGPDEAASAAFDKKAAELGVEGYFRE